MLNCAKKSGFVKRMAAVLALVFSVNSVFPVPAMAQVAFNLPAVATVSANAGYFPVHLRALNVRVDEPLVFDFVVDNGSTELSGEALKKETEKLAKYFLAAVTIPEKELWVNLSPYENDRIIPNELGLTEMGRVMLAQDSALKRYASSILHPDSDTGKAFWSRVYAAAKEQLGTTEVPLDTLSKVWIVPNKAVVYENNNTVLLGELSMKVMLARDYFGLAASKAQGAAEDQAAPSDAMQEMELKVMREVMLPAIEKEVNTGEAFAQLRQVYGAMVLATWYKKALKDSLLSQVYANQKKTAGVNSNDPYARKRIYKEYLKQFSKGAFNLIHEDADPVTGEIIPRKYFSGGESYVDLAQRLEARPQSAASKDFSESATNNGQQIKATVALATPNKVFTRIVMLPTDFPAGILTSQSLPSVAFAVANLLGRKNELVLDANDLIAEGDTFEVMGNNRIRIKFKDKTSVFLEFNGREVKINSPVDVDGKALRTILIDELINDARFSNAGFDSPVALSTVKYNEMVPIESEYEYESSISLAWHVLGQTGKPVMVVDNGKKETFGVYYDGVRLVLEKAFLKRVHDRKNAFGMLTRAVIFAVTQDDWLGKQLAAFSWARKEYADEIRENKTVSDVLVMENELLQELNWKLLERPGLTPETKMKIKFILDDEERRILRSTAGIGMAVMDDRINEHALVFYPLAADPYHFGQDDAIRRGFVRTKTANCIMRLQGADFRKILTLFTEVHRKKMISRFVKKPGMKPFISMPLEHIGTVDGETQVVEFLVRLALTNPEKLKELIIYYLVGTDHMHGKAPGKKRDPISGLRLPEEIDGKVVRDTIPKLLEDVLERVERLVKISSGVEEMPETGWEADFIGRLLSEGFGLDIIAAQTEVLKTALVTETTQVIGLFNERSSFDGEKTHGETLDVDDLIKSGRIMLNQDRNLGGASSTAIRLALAGIPGFEWALALLPSSILLDIESNDVYRALAIKLRVSMWNIYNGTPGVYDYQIVNNWLTSAMKNGFDVSPENIAQELSLSEQDAEKAKKLDSTLTDKDFFLPLAVAKMVIAQALAKKVNDELQSAAPALVAGAGLNKVASIMFRPDSLALPNIDELQEKVKARLKELGLRVIHQLPRFRPSDSWTRDFYNGLAGRTIQKEGQTVNLLESVVGNVTSGEVEVWLIEPLDSMAHAGAALTVKEKVELRSIMGGNGTDPNNTRLHASSFPVSREDRNKEHNKPGDDIPRYLKALGIDYSANSEVGGIDFDSAMLNMTVERTGNGVKVNIDPAEIQRIKTRGVDGFAPVVINMMQMTGSVWSLNSNNARPVGLP
ncbi:MAG: hypothetical protein HQL20_03875 [Candidatus Omnitrophica bacterium]|nr:hypothetical protein [Candidatus Omnitrophota bacterium]